MSRMLMSQEIMKEIRLQVFLAQCGLGSRRKCEELIKTGLISVNGITVDELGRKISGQEFIQYNGKPVQLEKKIYLAVNKPVRYLCSNYDEEGRPLVKDLFADFFPQRLFHVGRLDYLSSGLIFYTNDGIFANIISHPSFEIEKDYLVNTLDPLSIKILERFKNRTTINGIEYQLKRYKILNESCVVLTLLEGKNREIRNFLKEFNIGIQTIHRIRIGILRVEGIGLGKYKQFTEQQLDWFFKKFNK